MSGCAPNQTVVFSYSTWQAVYPEFNGVVSAGQAEMYFDLAQTLFLSNTAYGRNVVWDLNTRAKMLGLLTAHIAKLLAGSNNEGPSDLVGRISSASQGSVSVSAAMPDNPDGAWFQQTKYGAMYWEATRPYRTFRYRQGPQPYLGVGGFGRFGYRGNGY